MGDDYDAKGSEALKPAKCKVCKKPFTKTMTTQRVCSLKCALELTRIEREAKEKKSNRLARINIRTRSEWLKLAQAQVNKFVRFRDGNLCISCGRVHQGQIHAGHYLSVGARPELRFELDNIHSQCSACNNYLSGNITLYRINLIKKIGLERVEWLEGPHDAKKYTIEELQDIIKVYKLKIKELDKRNG